MKNLVRFLLIAVFACSAAGLGILPFLGNPGLANPKTAGVFGLWVNFLGQLHPVFLHLPIGALLLLVTMEGLGIVTRGKVRIDATWALLFAFGTALLALVTGYSLYLTGNYTGELIQMHKRDAFLFCGVLLVTTAWSLWFTLAGKKSLLIRGGYFAGLGLSVLLMTKAGHYGGEITHGDPLEQLPPKILADRKAAAEALAKDPVVFTQIVQPIFSVNCVYCHGADKQEGDFRMDSMAALLKGGEKGPGLVAADSEKSQILQRIHLPLQDKLHMPPSDKPQLSPEDITFLKWWIEHGASDTARVSQLKPTPEVDAALANLVSPEQRKAIEEEKKRLAQEEADRVRANKAKLEPMVTDFNAAFPGSLKYVNAGTDRLRFIIFSHAGTFGADGVAKLQEFGEYLAEADLTLSTMDSAALSGIAGLKSLQRLNASQTGADDAFVASISELPSLEILNLFGTKVTPASADSLAKMKSLRTVYVAGTGIDAAGALALEQKLAAANGRPVRVVGAPVTISTAPQQPQAK
jgi:uncharacterized membrane protein/mono/diheme cytochrome c family protein